MSFLTRFTLYTEIDNSFLAFDLLLKTTRMKHVYDLEKLKYLDFTLMKSLQKYKKPLSKNEL